MKQGLQIIKNIELKPAETKILTEKLKEQYENCVGVLCLPDASSQNLSGVTMQMSIAQKEILPKGTDLSLITFNGKIARDKTAYRFESDNIPARSSDLELEIVNESPLVAKFSIYLFLTNK